MVYGAAVCPRGLCEIDSTPSIPNLHHPNHATALQLLPGQSEDECIKLLANLLPFAGMVLISCLEKNLRGVTVSPVTSHIALALQMEDQNGLLCFAVGPEPGIGF